MISLILEGASVELTAGKSFKSQDLSYSLFGRVGRWRREGIRDLQPLLPVSSIKSKVGQLTSSLE